MPSNLFILLGDVGSTPTTHPKFPQIFQSLSCYPRAVTWHLYAVQAGGGESNSIPLSEVKIYNRCAPSCVFAGANATHLAFAPFDGDFDFAMRCCLPEPGLSVGIGVYA